jgi:hypothetical protein
MPFGMITQPKPDSKSAPRGASVFSWLANLLAMVATLSLGFVGLAFWQGQQTAELPAHRPLAATATPRPDVDLPVYTGFADQNPPAAGGGIPRRGVLHTTLPDYSAFEIRAYEVKSGDTLFGIAQVYDLKPQTLLFGNYDILYDDPHRLNVGQTLRILPMNGLLYTWA